jgi:hypothetical protein
VQQNLQTGMVFELETTVGQSDIVEPDLPVLSTPSMIRLMEHAALQGIAPYLPGRKDHSRDKIGYPTLGCFSARDPCAGSGLFAKDR